MKRKHEDAPERVQMSHLMGQHPMRALLKRTMQERGVTAEGLGKAIGFADGRIVEQYLNGPSKLPINRAEMVASVLELEFELVLRAWLTECYPDVLELLEKLPAPPLLTATERRLIAFLREHTDKPGSELVIGDGVDLVAFVLARSAP